MTTSEPSPPGGLTRPEGSTIDLDLVRAVATESNRAQRRMATELLSVRRHGATIAVPWRGDLADETDALASGVVAAMLDHACSLAALLSLDDPARFGTTMSLRVDHLSRPRPGRPLHAGAEALPDAGAVMTVHGWVFDPNEPDRRVARAICTVAVAR